MLRRGRRGIALFKFYLGGSAKSLYHCFLEEARECMCCLKLSTGQPLAANTIPIAENDTGRATVDRNFLTLGVSLQPHPMPCRQVLKHLGKGYNKISNSFFSVVL